MNTLALMLAGFGGYAAFELIEGKAPLPNQSPPAQNQTTSKYAPITGKVSQNLTASIPPKLNTVVQPFGGGVPKNPSFVNPKTNGSSTLTLGPLTKLGGGLTGLTALTGGAIGPTRMSAQLVNSATQKAADEYNKLSASARKSGADQLNKLLKPSPGLTGNETWEDASKKVGASLGTLVGGALGGPATAALGAMVGAYLGEKLGDWLQGKWTDIQSWAGNTAKTVEDKVETAAKDAYNDVASALSHIF